MKSFAKTLLHSSCAAARDGPNRRRPRAAKQVGDAAVERQLGSDDGEIDALALGELRRAPSTSPAWTGTQPGDSGDAGVARRAQDLRHAGFARELPGEGMLAAAAADDEDFHASRSAEAQLPSSNYQFQVRYWELEVGHWRLSRRDLCGEHGTGIA